MDPRNVSCDYGRKLIALGFYNREGSPCNVQIGRELIDLGGQLCHLAASMFRSELS
ncbi:MAG: hypothetical protein IIA67_08805 [Planctomycetes bacterium]|nr:hypothetical protein [Planctomycetota bacterium]